MYADMLSVLNNVVSADCQNVSGHAYVCTCLLLIVYCLLYCPVERCVENNKHCVIVTYCATEVSVYAIPV